MEINIIIQNNRRGTPGLELRKETTSKEEIEKIIKAAWYRQPITIMPTFTKPLEAIKKLEEKGLIRKEGDEYYFS